MDAHSACSRSSSVRTCRADSSDAPRFFEQAKAPKLNIPTTGLTEYEQEEILQFSEVFYTAPNAPKTTPDASNPYNFGFDMAVCNLQQWRSSEL